MKSTLQFLFFLMAFNLFLNAQPVIQWQHSFGGSDFDHIRSVHQTFEGGYILGGNTTSSNGDVTGQHGDYDNWVIKLDNSGNVEWKYCYGGSSGEELRSICQTTDSGYFVVGYTSSTNGDVSGGHGSADFWIYKLDKTGSMLWQKCLGGSGDDQGKFGIQTSDGGYIVTGWTNSNDGDVSGLHGSHDEWVVKLDSTGSIQWQKCIGGSDFDFGASIEQTNDNGYIVGGRTASSDGDVTGLHDYEDFWILKLDSNGNLQWQKCLGGSDEEEFYSIQHCNDGGYIGCGYTMSSDGDISGAHGDYEAWVVKLDSTGDLQWQKCLGGSFYDAAFELQQTRDFGFIVVGETYSTNGDVTGNHGSGDLWVIKLDPSGMIEWQKCLGGSLDEGGYAINQTDDDGFIIGGISRSFDGDLTTNNGLVDSWVIKLSSVTSADEIMNGNGITTFPNPSDKELYIQCTNNIELVRIYSLTGEIIYSTNLIYEEMKINTENLSNGLYFVEAQSKTRIDYKRFVVSH